MTLIPMWYMFNLGAEGISTISFVCRIFGFLFTWFIINFVLAAIFVRALSVLSICFDTTVSLERDADLSVPGSAPRLSTEIFMLHRRDPKSVQRRGLRASE